MLLIPSQKRDSTMRSSPHGAMVLLVIKHTKCKQFWSLSWDGWPEARLMHPCKLAFGSSIAMQAVSTFCMTLPFHLVL